jgi:hypothetical protein
MEILDRKSRPFRNLKGYDSNEPSTDRMVKESRLSLNLLFPRRATAMMPLLDSSINSYFFSISFTLQVVRSPEKIALAAFHHKLASQLVSDS